MRGVKITKDTSLAQCFFAILADDRTPNVLKDLIRKRDPERVRLLWEIVFDTRMEEVELLEERIYRYGSMIKGQDRLSREIFTGMVTLLAEIKNSY